VANLPAIPEDSALARLFGQPRVQEEATWFSLPGGSTLFAAGDTSDELYFVRAGRLGAFRREAGHEVHFLGVIRPGEPAGEMSLIAGAPHSADVVALRDTEILAVPRDTFFAACEAEPDVMIELAKLMMLRSRQAVMRGGVGDPSVFGFVPLGNTGSLRPLVERLAEEIGRLGYLVTTIGAEAQTAPTEWFSDVEKTHDFVLYVGEVADAGWLQMVARQVDRLFRVGRGDRRPPRSSDARIPSPLEAQGLVDLILLQPPDIARPAGSEEWLDAASRRVSSTCAATTTATSSGSGASSRGSPWGWCCRAAGRGPMPTSGRSGRCASTTRRSTSSAGSPWAR